MRILGIPMYVHVRDVSDTSHLFLVDITPSRVVLSDRTLGQFRNMCSHAVSSHDILNYTVSPSDVTFDP